MTRHLCGSCREITISDEAVASIENHLSLGEAVAVEFVHVLRDPHVPGIEYLRNSIQKAPDKRPCHLCALILRSLKDPSNVGTSKEDFGLPEGPVSLAVSIGRREITLNVRVGDNSGHPLTVSVGSDESCRGAEVSTESDSDEIFTKILAWCNDCTEQHEQCSSASDKETWLPGRVIYVGRPGGQLELRLLDTQGCTGRYITLTHRWTSLTEASGTTTSNINRRRVSIATEELSDKFQDAVEVTRKLGIQYLWIDALCIVQNSQQDWRTEAKNMASIYELAWLNIVSAGSEKTEGRLFMKRDSRLSRPCRLPATFSKLSRILPDCDSSVAVAGFCKSVSNHMIASESAPWGWENHTSMVKINSHFHQLKRNHIEVRGDLTLDKSAGGDQSDMRIDTNRLNVVIRPTSLASLYEYWYKIVEIYSRKKLTVDMDKLPAIHGIDEALHRSRMAHTIFEECYYNGIWTEDLTRESLCIGEPGEPSHDYLVTDSIRSH